MGQLNQNKGKLIVVEGVDGSGKGTLLKQLAPAVQSICDRIGLEFVLSKEPGGTYVGTNLRHLLFENPTTKKMHPDLPAFLMLCSHLQHTYEKIQPALNRGAIVLLDRYYYSHYAYQSSRGGHPLATLAYELLQGPPADLILFLRGDPERLLQRAIDRKEDTHQQGKSWSNLDAQRKVLAEYDHMFSSMTNVVQLDAEAHPRDIFVAALKGIEPLGLC